MTGVQTCALPILLALFFRDLATIRGIELEPGPAEREVRGAIESATGNGTKDGGA